MPVPPSERGGTPSQPLSAEQTIVARTLDRASELMPKYIDSSLANRLNSLSSNAHSLLSTAASAIRYERSLPNHPTSWDIRDVVLHQELTANLPAEDEYQRTQQVSHAEDDTRFSYDQRRLIEVADHLGRTLGIEQPTVAPLEFPEGLPVAPNSQAARLYLLANTAAARVAQLPEMIARIEQEAQEQGLPDLPAHVLNAIIDRSGAYVPSYEEDTYEARRAAFLRHVDQTATGYGNIALSPETANVLRVVENAQVVVEREEERYRTIERNERNITRAVDNVTRDEEKGLRLIGALSETQRVAVARETTRLLQAEKSDQTITAQDLTNDGTITQDVRIPYQDLDLAQAVLNATHGLVPEQFGNRNYTRQEMITLTDILRHDRGRNYDWGTGTMAQLNATELIDLVHGAQDILTQTITALQAETVPTQIEILGHPVELATAVEAFVAVANENLELTIPIEPTPATNLAALQALHTRISESAEQIALGRPAEIALNVIGSVEARTYQAVNAETLIQAIAETPRSGFAGLGRRARANIEPRSIVAADPTDIRNRVEIAFTVDADAPVARAIARLRNPRIATQINTVLTMGTPERLRLTVDAHGQPVIEATYYDGSVTQIPLQEQRR